MELKEIQEYQEKFDVKHGWNWKHPKDVKEKLNFFQYVTVALTGELGEFANQVKKIMRDYNSLGVVPNEKDFKNLKEEITDCFIYVLITANILHMDLEKEYLKKIEYNEKRFRKYKKK